MEGDHPGEYALVGGQYGKVYMWGSKYKCAWTNPVAGNKFKFGGWVPNALRRWNQLRVDNRQARMRTRLTDLPNTAVMEAACMARIKEKHGITAETLEEHEKAKRKRAKTAPAEPEKFDFNVFDE